MAKSKSNPALPGGRNAVRISNPYPGTSLPAPAYTPGGRVPISPWPAPGNYVKGAQRADGKPWDPAEPAMDMDGDCPGD
jgi:hypothetical protein